ncbi:3,4-dihydroxy-2-butanone 4-phosphate synthase-domain-containing protein [Tribonema minus]|uniref:GTP cyclohydrolase II n=1 Tax=Tribonema minus TaxID=303371 RepID=A0A835ZPV4_9STRA|nr:3,4-dihydroxy-2-butanone 4-phosphate synthase-domain-containing protein [Tribonema minus]
MPAIFKGEGSGGESDCFTRFVSECKLPTRKGTFRLRAYSYEGPTKGLEPLAIVSGDIGDGVDVPVRVHDQCVTSEVLGSMRCDCREQLELSLDYIHRHGGIVIYMQQEGRGIGLANKIAAYSLQDQGLDTVDANRHLGFEDDYRSYEAVEFILRDLGVKSVQLMTNNPFKLKCLKAMGIKVQARIPMLVAPNPHSERYLQAKSRRMSHLLALDDAEAVVVEAAAAAVTATAATAVAGDTPVTKLRGGAASEDGSELCVDSSELCVDSSELCEDDGECETETWAFGRETVVAAIKAVGEGKLVVVTDDEDRENEGDLICAGSCATEDLLAFMIRYTSGVICVSLEGERLDELQIPPMVAVNEDPKATAFAVTVDAKHGTTTGISAKDRSNTLMTLANPDATAADFNRPGHIFPLRYCKGGVLKRGGHTEAALDLARLAGLPPVGVLCEITTADGRDMARLPELREFCKEHGLVLTSIRDMRCYLREKMEAQAHS